MFERFTDRARRVIVLAQEEARTLQHNYIGTEHLLLGLIREGEGVAAKALASKGVTLDDTRKQVEEMIGKGNASPNGHIPFTPHARQVLELSLREALQLGHSYIGTEHILLGLIHEGEGVGTQVLIKMDVNLGELRSATIDLIRGNSSDGKNDSKGELANAGGVQDRRNQTGSAILDQFGRNLTAEAAAGGTGPGSEARSGDRTIQRDRACDGGVESPHQEQPGADRRAWRRQDRGGRRTRAEDQRR